MQVATLTDQLQETKTNLRLETEKLRFNVKESVGIKESFKEGLGKARCDCATDIASY